LGETVCGARWSDEPNFAYPRTVVLTSPQTFLDKCPPLPYSHEDIESMTADVVRELRTTGRHRPFLRVDITGQVLDHEGRIRAIAAKRLGCEIIPVEIYFYDEKYYEYLEPPRELPPLKPQRWTEIYTRRGEPVPPTHAFHMDGLTVRVLGPATQKADMPGGGGNNGGWMGEERDIDAERLEEALRKARRIRKEKPKEWAEAIARASK